MGRMALEKVEKSFGDVTVIPPLDLEIEDGGFVVFVGPSGCGKSTLLRLIAGLEDVTGGTIRIDGQDATTVPPAKRGLAMVFQSYALYRTPRNRFVAGFIGSPRMNFLEGPEAAKHDAHTIGIRPEHITPSPSEGTWKGHAGVSEYLGSDTFLHVHMEGCAEPITVRSGGEVDMHHGDTIYMTPEAGHIHRLDGQGLRIA